MVMLGRPVLYALAAGGEAGLQQWLASLGEELGVALSQLGLSSIQDVGPQNLASMPFAQR
jgi:isopentenyl diphosphate isomerase/L-lactate dehydrogenase-like FMN-dependent dehydrogenase